MFPQHDADFALATLGDLKILDLSEGLAGPLCARFLGDFGANVIKVELPEGDAARRWEPFAKGVDAQEASLIFQLANVNKRGVTVDYRTADGIAALRVLIADADIVVESCKPGMLAELGLGYDVLRADNPRLILISITPFGQTGPYRDWQGEEIVTYALSGIMSISGLSTAEPLKHGGMQSQYEGALSAAVAASVAIFTRDLTGEGQHIDVSLQDVVASTLVIQQPFYSWAGAVQGRRQPDGSAYGQVQPCKDGYFIWQTGGGAEWQDIAAFFDREELKEARFETLDGRQRHAGDLDRNVLEATQDRTMLELFRTASEDYRMLFGIAQEPKDIAACEHLRARDFFETAETSAGPQTMPFRLFSMTEGGAVFRCAAPRLGEHNDLLLAPAGSQQ
ncbi:MAG: CoA transferase [Rhodobacteraceae bacterium]|nr:CoA transferase [Paracoccaceae bacterium]